MNLKEDMKIPEGATQLIGSIAISAAKNDVWEVVKTIGDIENFHPLIKRSYATNDRTGVGATRHCDLKPMGAMDEEVIQWEDGSGFTAKVIGGKMLPPFELMVGELCLENMEGGTRATFTFTYKLKFGVFGNILNVLLVKPQFRSAPNKYVEGLKSFVEKH